MDRWDWMSIKMYVPAAMALVAAFVSTLVIGRFEASSMFSGIADTFGWVPYAALVAAAVLGTWATVRLMRAERGLGLLCECGGILGGERRGRWGNQIRTCMACGKHWSRKHYE